MNAHGRRTAVRQLRHRWPLGRRVRSYISGGEATIVGHVRGEALKLRYGQEVICVHADYVELVK